VPELSIPIQVGFEETFLTMQPLAESQRGQLRPVGPQCTFPDDCYTPPGVQQFFSHPSIPRYIVPEFRLPEIRPSGGNGRIWAFLMTMPEAAMHETDSSKPTEDQVRRPRQLPVVKTVSETAHVQRASKRHLRFRILAADSGHHSRPDRLINYINHRLSCAAWTKRHRVRIPKNIFEVIKENAAILGTVAWSEPELQRAPKRDRNTSFMQQLQGLTSISHIIPSSSGPHSGYLPNGF